MNESGKEIKKTKTLRTLTKKDWVIASIICMLAALFYMYEFILQVSPAVMTHELMRDLNLNAASLGAMSAFYYYAYTPMQLPAGLLFDRFGPRFLLTLATLICAFGALFFSLSEHAFLAGMGRFFMGVGSAFSFIGALLLVSRWFPPQYFALLTGIVQLMSSIGAVGGEAPLAAAIEHWSWRPTLLVLALCGFILAALIALFVRDYPKNSLKSPRSFIPSESIIKKSGLRRLQEVGKNKQTWLIAIYAFCVWAPITAFAALWGIPFLTQAYSLTTPEASAACAMIWLAIGIGSPLIGWWSDKIKSRCLPLTISAFLGVIGVSLVIYIPHLSLINLYIALFIFGLAASGQSLAFGVVKDNNSEDVVGTAIGLNNMAVVAGGALFQPLIGAFLYLTWNGLSMHTVPIYSALDYRKAFLALPLCYLLAMCISHFFLRETHCQSMAVDNNNSFEADLSSL